MRLYNALISPNARRMRIFLAEKGLAPDTVNLDLPANEQRTPEYLAINSLGQVPALVLDDGSVITESVAICRYLDALHPEPPLFGTGAREIATVEMWIRRMELGPFRTIGDVAVHTLPFFAGRVAQNAAYADAQRTVLAAQYRWLDAELADRPFVAGEAYTMADVVGLSGHGLATYVGVAPDRGLRNLWGWIERVEARPSAAA